MTTTRTVSLAFRSLLAHPMRSVLTMLGIIIGTACVIAIVSMGEGAQQAMMENMTKLGSNLLFVRPGAARSGHVAVGNVTTLRETDADAIRAAFGDRIVDLEIGRA